MTDKRAEESLVSCVISNPSGCLPDVLEITDQEAFSYQTCEVLFKAAVYLFDKQEAVNLVSVCTQAKKMGVNLDVEAADIVSDYPYYTYDHIAQARTVQGLYERRGMAKAGEMLVRMSSDMSEDVLDIREAVEQAVYALRRHGSIEGVRDTATVISSLMEHYTNAEELRRQGKTIGVTTGIPDLDKLTLGWRGGKLYVLAARPSVGKTAIGISFAFDAGVPVLIFSLEMSAEEIVERRLMPDADVLTYTANTGRMKELEWLRVRKTADSMAKNDRVFIDDRPGLTIQQIKSTARRMKIKHDVGLVIVDYIQLAYASSLRKGSTREQEVAQISKGMKEMAKELGVPVIALSQLNRAVTHDEKPNLGMLRESGAIEQDSDVVMFAYREPDISGERSSIVNLCIDKHRGGPLGDLQLTYLPGTARLVPYSEREQRNKYEPTIF